MTFEPIAIVGRSCLLPGAHDPESLFDHVLAGRDLVSDAPQGRWGIAKERILTPDPKSSDDRAWSDRGGYVTGFEAAFDPSGFELPAETLEGLDPLVLWILHTARAALRDAGFTGDRRRVSAYVGNLSFPSAGMARFAERVYLGDALADRFGLPTSDPRDRFMSGLPAHLLAQALGLGGEAYALDAACASSLYAIALGCSALHDRRADAVLAGAVNRADDLFIHVGFCALGALSKSGRSRPFDRDADGLLPAEGAGFVVLKRLADAERDGDTIHGVIRGVGLANDGRGRGLLAPAEEGQVRALRAAYDASGVDPRSVQYVECHATGTPVGDATEIRSLTEVFGSTPLVLSSLKANLGHLITVAGLGAVVKVLEGMRRGVLPPTPGVERPNETLVGSGFRVLSAPEAWPADARGVRRAGVSAFGFGGNDAHLVLESYDPTLPRVAPVAPRAEPIAITGIGLRVGTLVSAAEVLAAVEEGRSLVRTIGGRPAVAAETVSLALEGLRFPPNDLAAALPQQTLLLAATRDALAGASLPPTRTSVLVGVQCDAEVARYGARWRAAEWLASSGLGPDDLAKLREEFVPVLRSAGVLGTMPNIPANRMNSQFDLGGPSYTLAAEELSGIRALEIAVRDLAAGVIDAAVVGASDVVAEPVHAAAVDALMPPSRRVAGDAAVALVLERLDDARRAGRPILAVVDANHDAASAMLGLSPSGSSLGPMFGDAHAATGLLHVAVGALLLAKGSLRDESGPSERARVFVEALGGQRAVVALRREPGARLPDLAPIVREPRLTFPAHRRSPSPTTVLGVSSSLAVPRPSAPRGERGAAHVPEAARAASPRPSMEKPMSSASMPRAPALPSTHEDHVHVAPELTQPRPDASPSHAGVAQVVPAAAPVMQAAGETQDRFFAALAHLQSEQASAHQAFLEAQQALHTRYLALRERSLFALVSAAQPAFQGGEAWSGAHDAPEASLPSVPAVMAPAPVAPVAPMRAPSVSPVPTAPSNGHAALPTPVAPTREVAAPQPSVAPPAALPTTHGKVRPGDFAPSERPIVGPTFDRAALEIHAGGTISRIFGETFAQQDAHAVQVRMPEPPLLLADRVVGIDAVPGSMGKGTVWTETDVTRDKWFLHDGYVPAGILIECGQADLFLISYLGVDFLNRGERAYRLLGCELTYHGNLPTLGETMRYDIHVDGHANHGDVRLFFFHYDCRDASTGRRILSVRQGQAGFFTRAELDDSAGILWKPAEQELAPNPRLDPPRAHPNATSFDRPALEAFAAGDAFGCFGKGYDLARSHNRGPRIPGGRMLLQDAITHLELAGGPWKRGYLRAVQSIDAKAWFFDGHFKNDPCMPGTLMFEGCLSLMAFYLGALGYTLERDGWRFQPVPEERYQLLCRGQVVPTSKELVYEVFVEEVHDGPIPTLYADLLCTVDGLGAFHARRMAVQLVPDWPLTSMPELLENYVEAKPVAEKDGFRFDYASLLACAWGKPSHAFGPMYRVFDGTRKVARLPGPPYHFMSRVTRADGPIGVCKAGAVIEIEYDVPPDEWYFRENGYPSMPFCVFLEAALQPCGWLASYVGSALTVEDDLMFRNLDGDATFLAEVFPTSGTFRTVVKITNISQSAGMIIESFDVDCYVGDVQVYDLKTVFGFFPKSAFENQVGLPVGDAERAHLTSPSTFTVDLRERPAKYCTGTLRLPEPMLLMLDRVTAFDPQGGKNGKGFARGEKDVDTGEWFFKAHFFQDPVQPGSLGLEAMLQLLQFTMIELGLGDGVADARFEPILVGKRHVWKYRGQVVPKNELISSTLEILETGRDERGVYALADASLWVDGKRIYEMKNLGMRIVSGGLGGPPPAPGGSSGKAPSRQGGASARALPAEVVLDPGRDRYLADHMPTFVIPALPMMSMVDRLFAEAIAEDPSVRALEDVRVERWLPVERPVRTRTRRHEGRLIFEAFRDAADARLSRFEAVASAVSSTPVVPPSPEPLRDARDVSDPYLEGRLFHGPAFRMLVSLTLGSNGSTAILDASLGTVPRGALHPGLLDALTHGIPHDALSIWDSTIAGDVVAYPHKLPRISLLGPVPSAGRVRVEARYAGLEGGDRFPAIDVVAYDERDLPFVSFRMVEILMPKGPLGAVEPAARRSFLRDRQFERGVSLARVDGEVATLAVADVRASDWLRGTVATVYGADPTALDREVAVRDLVASLTATHPANVRLVPEGAISLRRPLEVHPLAVDAKEGVVVARRTGAVHYDDRVVRTFWRGWFGLGRWPVEDLYFGLLEAFVSDVEVVDPDALARVAGRSVIFVGNHQTGIESLLFSIVASALVRTPTLTLAKVEHQESWLGRLIRICFAYPGARDPGVIAHFDRADPESLPKIVRGLSSSVAAESKSLMVHVEGTRALAGGQRIAKMSGVFVDLAIAGKMPVVPVRFVDGLPRTPVEERLEFPVGLGKQRIVFGAPILPAELAAMNYKARNERVANAIDALVPDLDAELGSAPNPTRLARAAEAARALGRDGPEAVVLSVLASLPDLTPETRELVHRLLGTGSTTPDAPRAATPFVDSLERWFRG